MGGYQSKVQKSSGDVSVGARIRAMGSHEAYQTAMHRFDQYRGTVVACRYYPPAGLAPTALKNSIVNALARVVLDQPHLHVGITDEETRHPAFVRLDHLSLRDHVEWLTCDDDSQIEKVYVDTMQSQLDSRFDNLSTRPGWRLIILQGTNTNALHILYVWNHAHHDGMSGKIFHRQFLHALNETAAPDKALVDMSAPDWTLVLPNDVDKLPPNGEIICSWPLEYGFFLKWAYNDFKPVSFFPGAPHAFWAPIKCTPYATRFRTFTINSETVENIVSTCRMHDTTVTGLMHALVLVSLTCSLEPASGTGFASRTPYDLRHFLPARTPEYPWLDPKESMCNWDSVLDHEFAPELVARIREIMANAGTNADLPQSLPEDVMDAIWSTSAQIRAEIAARIAMGTRNDLLAVMGWCPDWNIQQQREARRTRYLSWLVTNIGVVEGKSQEKAGWSFDRAELVLSAEVPSAAFSVSLMTVKGEQMCVTCSWQEAAVEERIGNKLLSDLETWLNGIGA
ncbi:alcohol acetyltransferase-domain-containing protein [Ampelomyces quisqualis]|uniref:Alcohol acetyltransferase-domain-containing protein n=1 Tax=Ampelomyces quisqualis TaxID=50730 RepID=A0A6A5QGD5_AMPQU|nr:alcohol acetyltransferase-domain-containing protein [Ampelomyces quisqualis]